jgi:hypothetical protein
LLDVPSSSVELSSDVSSSSFIKDVSSSSVVEPSSPEQLVRHSHRLHRPLDCYTPSAFTATALSEPSSYRDAILHSKWQHTMAEEIATLEWTGTWDIIPCPPHVYSITCKWVYKIKTRSGVSLEHYKARLVAHDF